MPRTKEEQAELDAKRAEEKAIIAAKRAEEKARAIAERRKRRNARLPARDATKAAVREKMAEFRQTLEQAREQARALREAQPTDTEPELPIVIDEQSQQRLQFPELAQTPAQIHARARAADENLIKWINSMLDPHMPPQDMPRGLTDVSQILEKITEVDEEEEEDEEKQQKEVSAFENLTRADTENLYNNSTELQTLEAGLEIKLRDLEKERQNVSQPSRINKLIQEVKDITILVFQKIQGISKTNIKYILLKTYVNILKKVKRAVQPQEFGQPRSLGQTPPALGVSPPPLVEPPTIQPPPLVEPPPIIQPLPLVAIEPVSSRIPTSLFLLSSILLSRTNRNNLLQLPLSEGVAPVAVAPVATVAVAPVLEPILAPVPPRISSSLFLLSTILLSTTNRNNLLQLPLPEVVASETEQAQERQAIASETEALASETEALASETAIASETETAIAPETETAPETQALAPETQALAPETQALAPETEAIAPETQAQSTATEALAAEIEALVPETEALAAETVLAPESSRIPTSLFLLSTILLSIADSDKMPVAKYIRSVILPLAPGSIAPGSLASGSLAPGSDPIAIARHIEQDTGSGLRPIIPELSQELINILNSFMKLDRNTVLRDKLRKIDKIIDDNISNIDNLNAELKQFNILITSNNICINIEK